jgi:hypothetical protein
VACVAPANATSYTCGPNGVVTVTTCDTGFYLLNGGCTGMLTCALRISIHGIVRTSDSHSRHSPDCTKCSSNQWERTACTTTSNRECVACVAPANAAAYTCGPNGVVTVTTCDTGFYRLNGVCTGMLTCALRISIHGIVRTSYSHSRHSPDCTKCSSNQWERTACTTTSNRECVACVAPANAPAYTCGPSGVVTVTTCDTGFYLLNGACTGISHPS